MFSRLIRCSFVSFLFLSTACSPAAPVDMKEGMNESSASSAASMEVTVVSPAPDSLVTSPLIVKGKAINTWFFEGSVPVGLLDADGNEIVFIGAMTQDDWMTEGQHEFEATLSFATAAEKGFVVIRKDNPSGDPERDAEVRIPVRFK